MRERRGDKGGERGREEREKGRDRPGLLAHRSRDTVAGARAGRRARCMGHGKAREGTGEGRPSTGRGRRLGRGKGCVDGEEGRKRRRERGRARERRGEIVQGSQYSGPTQGGVPWGPVGCQGSHCTHGRVDGQLTSTVVRVTASAAAKGGRAARAASHHICRVP